MQYNHYPSAAHSTPSTNDYASPYSDPALHHSTLSYTAVNPATQLPGTIGPQTVPPQYPYSYAAQGSPDDQRSYYTIPSQGAAVEHYPSPSSPTSSYATSSPHMSPPASRHHAHLPSQQQQQFIPTPSQTYQLCPSSSLASPARSRSTVEPYYHMSPNPQHVIHAPVSSTHATGGTGGRSSISHSSGSSHSHHSHASTHTSTMVVAGGERHPCDLCDRSFTRLHDRRRHYETVHATSPVLHKCRFCRKDFSRADSLKRHVDNGCDERPQ